MSLILIEKSGRCIRVCVLGGGAGQSLVIVAVPAGTAEEQEAQRIVGNKVI